jgi:hypothetical protein
MAIETVATRTSFRKVDCIFWILPDKSSVLHGLSTLGFRKLLVVGGPTTGSWHR